MDDYNTFAGGSASTAEDRTIAALFHSQGEAESAHDALRTAGFSHVTLSRKPGDGGDDKGLWQSIKDFFSGDRDADIYGEAVRRGKVLLTLHVSAGRAAEAIDIIDRYAPIDLDAHEKSWREDGWTGESVAAVGDTSEGHNREGYNAEPGPIPGRRDLDRGNLRVRSYVRDLG
ncbi:MULTISPECIES: hypothetical protein [Asticcacaulis]|uniref:hypothetical protein n=1 Tax=Asticcacaulis TaxID=76890 RepID=UPI001AEB9BDE|nr:MULTISPECIES: hypothetical protein [Asticcacaulis]MBP2157969.1 hypothetical protein [Asticcacaulis solisilvae]MDR6799014.1 hypothetical protein [Asticcacaulis sp. BE141]